ncbi:hypothetical protein CEXT_776401 [Caerostris extrusa]|uniref:Uncharacterized protein n=1 Tax=Caerostris extrusa TaxID=172846 RepID=A0AAV4UXH8_CAEEX|nr:hypothetical protein CEXT_776401 [Caerostris extrusa]
MAVSQQIIDRKCYIRRIIISSFIYFLIWKECASLSDESFDTFVAKTIMEDPWLDVNISEDNTVTQAASTKSYAIQSPTLKYPSEEIEVADGELWPNEKK